MMTPPPISYSEYLRLDQLLTAQHPRSEEYPDERTGKPAHDEMLFIITHQAYELWFKQMLHELNSIVTLFAQNPLPEPDVATALHRLYRMNKIGPVLLHHVDVLETMTPMDFLDFRGLLYPASGFQSLQFRLLEIMLGLPDEQRVIVPMQSDRRAAAQMEAAKRAPSLFSLLERWLERMPFLEQATKGSAGSTYHFWHEYQRAVSAMFEHDRLMLSRDIASEPMIARMLAQMEASEAGFHALFDEERYEHLRQQGLRRLSFKATQAALFIFSYREYPLLQLPFRLLEAVMELDELFSVWRYRHAQMAFRMIGSKVGTGGSSGHEYLMNATMKHKIFTDFSVLSAFLLPRKALPALPSEISSLLGFSFEKSCEQQTS
jgi:tryptophan 2,3-dioxygenase